MATATEQLQALDDAIHNLITGGALQSVQWNGVSYTYMSLPHLTELRKQLQSRVDSESADTSASMVSHASMRRSS